MLEKNSSLVFNININGSNEQIIFATSMGDIVLTKIIFEVNYSVGSDMNVQDVLLLSFFLVLLQKFLVL